MEDNSNDSGSNSPRRPMLRPFSGRSAPHSPLRPADGRKAASMPFHSPSPSVTAPESRAAVPPATSEAPQTVADSARIPAAIDTPVASMETAAPEAAPSALDVSSLLSSDAARGDAPETEQAPFAAFDEPLAAEPPRERFDTPTPLSWLFENAAPTREPAEEPLTPPDGSETDRVESAFEAPAFEAPAFDEPVFEAPAFEAPAFDAPLFDAPAFDAPAFEAPAFESPVFDAPAFDAPAFDAPAFDAPAFDAPAREASAFEAPAFEATESDVSGIEASAAEHTSFETTDTPEALFADNTPIAFPADAFDALSGDVLDEVVEVEMVAAPEEVHADETVAEFTSIEDPADDALTAAVGGMAQIESPDAVLSSTSHFEDAQGGEARGSVVESESYLANAGDQRFDVGEFEQGIVAETFLGSAIEGVPAASSAPEECITTAEAVVAPDADEVAPPRLLTVAETLEGIAHRVRLGEIVVAADAGASPEAVLASVLASLLTTGS